MRRRTTPPRVREVKTMRDWMHNHRMNQKQFFNWLAFKGLLVSPGYLDDVLNNLKPAGPILSDFFKEITGISLGASK